MPTKGAGAVRHTHDVGLAGPVADRQVGAHVVEVFHQGTQQEGNKRTPLLHAVLPHVRGTIFSNYTGKAGLPQGTDNPRTSALLRRSTVPAC